MADVDAGGRMTDLLVVGELCVDIIVALDGELRFGQHEQLVPSTTLTMGSSSAITACGAAAAGVRTTMVGVVGRDDFGDYIVRELASRGVDTSRIRIDESLPTGSSTHLTRPDGDRAILTAMGSIGEVRRADASPDALASARHLHIGSYFLQRSLWAEAPALYADARAAGLTTSLDGNFDPDEEWDRGILSVLVHTDVFFANEQELTGIARTATADDAVESLLDRMPAGAVVVCKLGADGAVAARRDGGATVRVHAGVPELDGRLVDTVGAGDSLAAGFLAGLLSGEPVERALALGVACGTASTRGAGGVGAQPDRTAAEALADRVDVHPS
ncbi:carbohydrate kinase family protein [Microbacterium sp. NPDC019599]|uniref:carbohydrate kinase family protein n=1 Tax=Microbacterium sp. NPDC019599 TaxID=3154690 RepID=UPI0033D4318B